MLHRCHLADFSTRLESAIRVPFVETAVPDIPGKHLQELLERLHAHEFHVRVTDRYGSDHFSVANVSVPGMERFVLVTDGQLVPPPNYPQRDVF